MRIVLYGWFIDYQIQLANFLSEAHTVMLVLPFDSLPEEHTEALDNKVELHLLGWHETKWYHYKNVSLPIRIIKAINKFNPDVIHVQGRTPHLMFWPVKPFFKKCPLVFTIHDVKTHLGEDSIIGKIIRWYAQRHFNHIIVHGDKLKEQMIEEHDLPDDKVYCIHIGEHEVAPFKKHERPGVEEEGNLILFFGRIHEYKGLEYLIKAEPLITQQIPDARIVIAGVGENFSKYEKLMGIRGSRFIVHNYHIPYQKGAELFQRCSVVVLPYIEASQSGVVSTAYGFSKPVIVTSVGSIPEVVDDGLTGLIVPPRDSEALAKAIVMLLKDSNLRKEMGENAYKKLKTDFSWDEIAYQHIEVYKQAMQNTRI